LNPANRHHRECDPSLIQSPIQKSNTPGRVPCLRRDI
jgi:hypothetical protein